VAVATTSTTCCTFCATITSKGVTRWVQFPGRQIAMGGANHYGGAEKSQQCHNYFIQYSTFASEIPQIRTLGSQTCFFPRAPSNLVTSLITIHVISLDEECCLSLMIKLFTKELCQSFRMPFLLFL